VAPDADRPPRKPRGGPVYGPSSLSPQLATVCPRLPRVAPSGAGLAGWSPGAAEGVSCHPCRLLPPPTDRFSSGRTPTTRVEGRRFTSVPSLGVMHRSNAAGSHAARTADDWRPDCCCLTLGGIFRRVRFSAGLSNRCPASFIRGGQAHRQVEPSDKATMVSESDSGRQGADGSVGAPVGRAGKWLRLLGDSADRRAPQTALRLTCFASPPSGYFLAGRAACADGASSSPVPNYNN